PLPAPQAIRRCTVIPITISRTAAAPMDFRSTERNGGENICSRALNAASSIMHSPLRWRPIIDVGRHSQGGSASPEDVTSGDGGGGGLLVGHQTAVLVGGERAARQVGPVEASVVEPVLDGRLHHSEIRRDIEVAWRVERRMADFENVTPSRAAFHAGDLRQ